MFSSIGVLRAVMTIVGAALGGWLGGTIGIRPTILVAAIGYTVPFFTSLFSPLRTATTDAPSTVPDA